MLLKDVREVAEGDSTYQRLKEAVQGEEKPKDRDIAPYTALWTELRVVQGLGR